MKLLADQLRQVKEEKFQVLLPPIPGWLHRCESCGRQAASKEDPLDPSRQGEKLDRICKDCKNKRKRGRDERDSLKSKGRETAISINKITGEDGCGYFAVLYADANDMDKSCLK